MAGLFGEHVSIMLIETIEGWDSSLYLQMLVSCGI